ncbi:unnamed protein product [Rhizophagus irregularis]|nr:unnamed protein product [Rhizophagus irregularis]
MTIVSDEKLFAIVLYSTFVNNEHLPSVRDIWKNSWVTGTSGALVIGLVGAIVVPLILAAIICVLGFGVEGVAAGSFGAWFMSLYGGMIARGSLISLLQSIGAAGLGTLGTSLSSSFGAAIGILIGAIGGSNLATYFKEMDLNDSENKIFGSLVHIEQNTYQNNHHMVIFTLMPALLYNDTLLRCFFETFIPSSPFANSKLFRFDFMENDLLLKSEKERLNRAIHNLLIDNYEKSRIEYIFRDNYLAGIKLGLNGYKSSNDKVNLLADIWQLINGNIVLDIDIDKIRDKFHDQIQNLSNYFHDKFNL